MQQLVPHLGHIRAEGELRWAVQRLLVGEVRCGVDVDDTDDIRVEHPVAFEFMGEQLLTHQLVQRFGEQIVEPEQIGTRRAVGANEERLIAFAPLQVLGQVGLEQAVGLGVPPFDQHELGEAPNGAVQERRVDAGALAAAYGPPVARFTEVVGWADVLERQVAIWFDLQHFGDARVPRNPELREQFERTDPNLGQHGV